MSKHLNLPPIPNFITHLYLHTKLPGKILYFVMGVAVLTSAINRQLNLLFALSQGLVWWESRNNYRTRYCGSSGVFYVTFRGPWQHHLWPAVRCLLRPERRDIEAFQCGHCQLLHSLADPTRVITSYLWLPSNFEVKFFTGRKFLFLFWFES